jgi:hypothetical protein
MYHGRPFRRKIQQKVVGGLEGGEIVVPRPSFGFSFAYRPKPNSVISFGFVGLSQSDKSINGTIYV